MIERSLHRFGLAAACVIMSVCVAPALHAQVGHSIDSSATARVTFVSPDDPALGYSEYVNATISAVATQFDRNVVSWNGKQHSPGTRVNFSSDATRIRVLLNYIATFPTKGAGIFRLEVDGQLRDLPIGSDTDVGVQSYMLVSQSSPVPREYSLIYPYASDVDFLGLELSGGTLGLLPPPAAGPPEDLYVAYGDSITHGFDATSTPNGYPDQVGRLQGWRVINMGFIGRKVNFRDGTAVGSLGGDIVTVEIGANDFIGEGGGPTTATVFTQQYNRFLDNIRLVQPGVPIFVITPIWYFGQGVPNSLGMLLEDYRQLIRDVVYPRTSSDPQLHLIEGLTLVPPGPSYFPMPHPNDAGFLSFATVLGGSNLVADPGYELDGYAWTDSGNSAITSDASSGVKALQIGPGAGGMDQTVGRVQRGTDYILTAWTKVGSVGEAGLLGISFHDAVGAELSKQEVQTTWTSYQQISLSVTTPTQFAFARLSCTKTGSSSFFYVDDVELSGSTP